MKYAHYLTNSFFKGILTGLGLVLLISSCKKEISMTSNQTKPRHFCTTDDHMLSGNRISGIGEESGFWSNGSVITVKFLNNNGSEKVQSKIKKYAKVWEKHANIKFKFVSPDEDAIVRILTDNEANSYVKGIGRALYNAPMGEHNVKFGGLTDSISESGFSRIILHEFGHILGFKHEHTHPLVVKINYDKIWQKAYWYKCKQLGIRDSGYSNKEVIKYADEKLQSQYSVSKYEMKWKELFEKRNGKYPLDDIIKEITDCEVVRLYPGLIKGGSWGFVYDSNKMKMMEEYDPKSIMHYTLYRDETFDGKVYPGHTLLSDGDQVFSGLVYPFPPF